VAPVQDKLDYAAWRAAALARDLHAVADLISPTLHDPTVSRMAEPAVRRLCRSIDAVANPYQAYIRHGFFFPRRPRRPTRLR